MDLGLHDPLRRCSDPPMNQRDRITIEAAVRLIRTRFRQHLLRKARAVPSIAETDYQAYNQCIDNEKTIEAAAYASWVTALQLWPDWIGSEKTQLVLRAYASHALALSIEKSAGFIARTRGQHEGYDVKSWVMEFIDLFRPDAFLVPNGVGLCASAT
jgi:hypothetical protein